MISSPWLKKILNFILSNAANWLKNASDFFTVVEKNFDLDLPKWAELADFFTMVEENFEIHSFQMLQIDWKM